MTDQPFKLSYTWSELEPVRPLYVTVLAAQLVGAAVSLSIFGTADLLEALWIGGALATLPGYLLGLPIQGILRPGSLAKNRQAIFLMGVVALFLTTFAVFFPPALNAA